MNQPSTPDPIHPEPSGPAGNSQPASNHSVTAAGQHGRVFTTEELFGNLKEVWIQHGDAQYRLRITSTGKLVLTK